MKRLDPPTHTVELHEADGRRVKSFTSHDPAGAAQYVRAAEAAHPGWAGTVEPLPANPIADALREVA